MEPGRDRWYEIRDELAVKLRELFSPLVLDAGSAVDVADVCVRETLGFPPKRQAPVAADMTEGEFYAGLRAAFKYAPRPGYVDLPARLECRDCELPVSEGDHAGHIFGARDA